VFLFDKIKVTVQLFYLDKPLRTQTRGAPLPFPSLGFETPVRQKLIVRWSCLPRLSPDFTPSEVESQLSSFRSEVNLNLTEQLDTLLFWFTPGLPKVFIMARVALKGSALLPKKSNFRIQGNSSNFFQSDNINYSRIDLQSLFSLFFLKC